MESILFACPLFISHSYIKSRAALPAREVAGITSHVASLRLAEIRVHFLPGVCHSRERNIAEIGLDTHSREALANDMTSRVRSPQSRFMYIFEHTHLRPCHWIIPINYHRSNDIYDFTSHALGLKPFHPICLIQTILISRTARLPSGLFTSVKGFGRRMTVSSRPSTHVSLRQLMSSR